MEGHFEKHAVAGIITFGGLNVGGRPSLTYPAEAVSRERHSDTETRVAWGRFKFVALDETDRPREIEGHSSNG